MILNKSYLKSEFSHGPLGSQSVLNPHRNRLGRPLIFTLALTSLIDAFSILVIFLLIQGPSGQKELNLSKDMKLPSVQQIGTMDDGVSVRIENGRYFVEEKEIHADQLVQRLYDIRQKMVSSKTKNSKSLIVQADRRSDFQSINPIIKAGSQTGFEQLKFAVIPRKGS